MRAKLEVRSEGSSISLATVELSCDIRKNAGSHHVVEHRVPIYEAHRAINFQSSLYFVMQDIIMSRQGEKGQPIKQLRVNAFSYEEKREQNLKPERIRSAHLGSSVKASLNFWLLISFETPDVEIKYRSHFTFAIYILLGTIKPRNKPLWNII